jgi:tetrapyrrole methylase family protein/MazG family protein
MPSPSGHIVVCGLGPGGPGRLTEAGASALSGPDPVYLRTTRHPGADRWSKAESFDAVYDRSDTFDDVYRTIADRLVDAAAEHGRIVYAVPGSPLVLERSVRQLVERSRSGDDDPPGPAVEVLPGLSFLDEAWARLGVDPIDDGVRLIDGHRFAVEAADQRGPLLVAHTHAPWVLSDIKLAVDDEPDEPVVVLQRLGTPDERIFEVAWADLDREVEPDHLTSLYLPRWAAPVGSELARSIEMMARLRRDCPWDREQTHASLRRFLIEEAYEVVEAIDRLEAAPDRAAASIELEEELGDLWFQILFHAELAREAGWFDLSDVARGLTDKMIGRHPHVYAADDGPSDPIDGSTVAGWEALKQAEKARRSAMDDVPAALPALAFADKVLKRAERAGDPADFEHTGERLVDLLPDDADADEVGWVLLAAVGRARRLGVQAEEALRLAAGRARDRFRAAEAAEAPAEPAGRWVRG